MKFRALSIAIFLAVLTLVSCRKKPTEAERNAPSKEQVAVTEMLNNYFQEMADSGIMSAELKYLDSSKEFFWVPPGYESAIYYDSVMTDMEEQSKGVKVVMKWDTLATFKLSDKLVSYTGIAKGVLTGPEGGTTDLDMIETGICIKRKDGWKLYQGQSRPRGLPDLPEMPADSNAVDSTD